MPFYDEQVLVGTTGSIVFPDNKFSSFLDAAVASQLNSDDLRNVGQALVMHNFLNILPTIKRLCPDPGLGCLLRAYIPNRSSGGKTCAAQIRTWCRGVRLKEEEVEAQDIGIGQ